MDSCSWIRKLIVEVTYLSHESISAAIFEYTFPIICFVYHVHVVVRQELFDATNPSAVGRRK